MAALGSAARELARRVSGGRVELRPDPLRCRLRFRGLTSSDEHSIDLTFSFTVAALDQPAERQMLAETFLSDRDAVTAEDVAAHFSAALREAAARMVESQNAEHWLGDSDRAPIIEALRAAAGPVAFASGVELFPPFELSVESPTVQREKLETMQRKLTERRAAGQAEHVQRAAELLRQFQSLRDAAPPGLSPGKILEQVSPADRGNMLETLLLASSSSQGEQTLWAVAGPNLVRIDARTAPPRCELIPLPGDLGPLRSVQPAGDGSEQLLIGAQSGVMTVDPQKPGEATRYVDRDITSPLGFNSVVRAGEMIWATHGEAGVVAWNAGDGDKPAFKIPPQNSAEGPRNAIALDDARILYSAGGAVFSADAGGTCTGVFASTGTVIYIAVEPDQVQIVRADGTIDSLDRLTLQRVTSARHCGEITAAAPLPWLGTTRLLLATADGPVCCVGSDDPLVTQYASPHRGLRAVAAAADLIAGLSADRQRIVLWKSWDGRQPAAEIHIGSIARHRAADVCFA